MAVEAVCCELVSELHVYQGKYRENTGKIQGIFRNFGQCGKCKTQKAKHSKVSERISLKMEQGISTRLQRIIRSYWGKY
jgi:hypothetical protein